jgi:hypothetical protein
VEAEQAQRVRVVRVLRWWLRQSADPVAEDGGDPLVTLAAWQAFQPVRAPTFLPGPLGFDDFAALLQLLSRLIQSSQGSATGRWSAVARQTPEGLESEVLARLISFKERLEEAAGRDSLPDPLRRLVEGSALA